MSYTKANSLLLLIFAGLFFSCQSSPETARIQAAIDIQQDHQDNFQDQADDIEGSYDDLKDELTAKMKREGFLIRRVVREKERFIRFTNQFTKLQKYILDQESRAVDEDLIEINRDISKYIEDVISDTDEYVKELDSDLLAVTTQGLELRLEYEKVAAQRRQLQKKILRSIINIRGLQSELDQTEN